MKKRQKEKNEKKKAMNSIRNESRSRKKDKFKSKSRGCDDEVLVNVAVELYRFGNACKNVITKLNEKDASRFSIKYDWFSSKMNDLLKNEGIVVQDLKGKTFDPGYPISAINLDDFPPDSKLKIFNMIEPVVIKNGVVKHAGTVTLELCEESN